MTLKPLTQQRETTLIIFTQNKMVQIFLVVCWGFAVTYTTPGNYLKARRSRFSWWNAGPVITWKHDGPGFPGGNAGPVITWKHDGPGFPGGMLGQ